MKVFDSKHIAKRQWLSHFFRASKISLIMICSGAIGLVHALVPFFLTDFLTLSVERIRKMLSDGEG